MATIKVDIPGKMFRSTWSKKAGCYKIKVFWGFLFFRSTTTLLPLLSKTLASVIGFHCVRNNGDRVFLSCRHWRVERAHETATRVGHVRARHARRGQYPRQPETELTHKQNTRGSPTGKEKKKKKKTANNAEAEGILIFK